MNTIGSCKVLVNVISVVCLWLSWEMRDCHNFTSCLHTEYKPHHVKIFVILRILTIHGAKTTKNQDPLVCFARLFYNPHLTNHVNSARSPQVLNRN